MRQSAVKVKVLEEAGYEWAMLGLSLSYLQPVEAMPAVSLTLTKLGQPHAKFLRQMHVWMDISGSWKWWKHLQTYNVGVDWPDFQSSSTMHKLLSRELTQDDFESCIDSIVLDAVNWYIRDGDLERAADHLPGAFIYRRVLCMNYAAIRNIIQQRITHRLKAWHTFIDQLVSQLKYQEYIEDLL